MLEFIILLCVAASIVWIVWKLRTQDRALKRATVEQAWRIVLNDPHYVQRRHYEEHKHEEETRLSKEAEGL
jgi:hypothetical protein